MKREREVGPLGHSPDGFICGSGHYGFTIRADSYTKDRIGVLIQLSLLLSRLSIPNPAGRSLFIDFSEVLMLKCDEEERSRR